MQRDRRVGPDELVQVARRPVHPRRDQRLVLPVVVLLDIRLKAVRPGRKIHRTADDREERLADAQRPVQDKLVDLGRVVADRRDRAPGTSSQDLHRFVLFHAICFEFVNMQKMNE